MQLEQFAQLAVAADEAVDLGVHQQRHRPQSWQFGLRA